MERYKPMHSLSVSSFLPPPRNECELVGRALGAPPSNGDIGSRSEGVGLLGGRSTRRLRIPACLVPAPSMALSLSPVTASSRVETGGTVFYCHSLLLAGPLHLSPGPGWQGGLGHSCLGANVAWRAM